jgi:hypothetical protein
MFDVDNGCKLCDEQDAKLKGRSVGASLLAREIVAENQECLAGWNDDIAYLIDKRLADFRAYALAAHGTDKHVFCSFCKEFLRWNPNV